MVQSSKQFIAYIVRGAVNGAAAFKVIMKVEVQECEG